MYYNIFQHDNIYDFEKIEVFKDNHLFQTLPTDSAYAYHDYEITMNLDDDANFDGYKDLKLLKFHGMVSAEYYFYLYDPKTKKYSLENSLSKILDPVFDPKTQTIFSTYHIGPSEFHYDTYKWKNGKAVLVDSRIEGGGY